MLFPKRYRGARITLNVIDLKWWPLIITSIVGYLALPPIPPLLPRGKLRAVESATTQAPSKCGASPLQLRILGGNA